MCEITGQTRRKEVKGYKIIAVDIKTGEFYSTFTGQKYILNEKIKEAPTICTTIVKDPWANVRAAPTWKIYKIYNKYFNGLTGIFRTKREMHWVLRLSGFTPNDTYNIAIVKVTLTGEIYTGYYGAAEIFAGNIIKDIKIIKVIQNKL